MHYGQFVFRGLVVFISMMLISILDFLAYAKRENVWRMEA